MGFEQRFNFERTDGLNIRVIEYGDDTPILSGKLGFFLTVGYSIGDVEVLRTIIKFCPYCGAELEKRYDKRFVNENNHSFISF